MKDLSYYIRKGQQGYSISIVDNSYETTSGIKFDYTITLFCIIKRKFLWSYIVEDEIDRFLYRDFISKEIFNSELKNINFNQIKLIFDKLGIWAGNRPAGYGLIPTDY